jgi:hypothetical protein
MFVVTEAEAAGIRAVFEQRGELSAAIELRRRFPGITDNTQARECARGPLPAGNRCPCRFARPGCISARDRDSQRSSGRQETRHRTCWGEGDLCGTDAVRFADSRRNGLSPIPSRVEERRRRTRARLQASHTLHSVPRAHRRPGPEPDLKAEPVAHRQGLQGDGRLEQRRRRIGQGGLAGELLESRLGMVGGA